MKKILSVLLIVCLILSLSICAFADNNKEKPELTFRDISFATPFSETIEKLKESGIDGEYVVYESDCMYTIIFVDKIEVAGYEMTLALSFRWASADNDKIEDSLLMQGNYLYTETFTSKDLFVTAFDQYKNDLLDKLESLYGKSSAIDSWRISQTYPRTMIATWTDNKFIDNDSLVMKEEATSGKSGNEITITINYFDGQADALLKETIIQANSAKHDANSKDGL